ncbi:MAG: hypothetical protein KDB58_08225 [Solirubrobacterales bacterium]|nr:hypothetical protein [Solirubrobacterales bacterium]MCB8970310.1 hypothetical protein [Thermoleophilales bacterium]MCO5325473.1 hypothetical protein [Solirubrobacterales bacterium]
MIRSNRSVRRLCVLVVAMIGIVLAAPAASYAQNINPTDEEYGNGILGISAGGNDGGSEFSGSGSSGSGISSLPFTGLDVVAIAAIGLGLVGAGFVVRRAAGSHESHESHT